MSPSKFRRELDMLGLGAQRVPKVMSVGSKVSVEIQGEFKGSSNEELQCTMAEVRGVQGRLGFDKSTTKTRLGIPTTVSIATYSMGYTALEQQATMRESILGRGS